MSALNTLIQNRKSPTLTTKPQNFIHIYFSLKWKHNLKTGYFKEESLFRMNKLNVFLPVFFCRWAWKKRLLFLQLLFAQGGKIQTLVLQELRRLFFFFLSFWANREKYVEVWCLLTEGKNIWLQRSFWCSPVNTNHEVDASRRRSSLFDSQAGNHRRR